MQALIGETLLIHSIRTGHLGTPLPALIRARGLLAGYMPLDRCALRRVNPQHAMWAERGVAST